MSKSYCTAYIPEFHRLASVGYVYTKAGFPECTKSTLCFRSAFIWTRPSAVSSHLSYLRSHHLCYLRSSPFLWGPLIAANASTVPASPYQSHFFSAHSFSTASANSPKVLNLHPYPTSSLSCRSFIPEPIPIPDPFLLIHTLAIPICLLGR